EPHLFSGIDWSTPRVLSQTKMRAAEEGLAIVPLAEWYDVDDWESLKRLYRELLMPDNSGSLKPQGFAAPATAEFLRKLAAESPAVGRLLTADASELHAP